MNTSGPAVATAWKVFLKDLPSEEGSDAKLIVVHDELESPMGKIKVKIGGSAKGHNGLKSCMSSLGGMAFTRIESESGDLRVERVEMSRPMF